MATKQDNVDEANFMSGMLEWHEVKTLVLNDGFKGNINNRGEVTRYLAWRLFQHNRRTGLIEVIEQKKREKNVS